MINFCNIIISFNIIAVFFFSYFYSIMRFKKNPLPEGLNGVVAFSVYRLKFWLFYGYRLFFFWLRFLVVVVVVVF